MFKWAILFLLFTAAAGYFGFKGGLQGTAMQVSKVLFFVFALLFVIFLVLSFSGGRCSGF